MNKDIQAYNASQSSIDKEICDVLYQEISASLPDAENKVCASCLVPGRQPGCRI